MFAISAAIRSKPPCWGAKRLRKKVAALPGATPEMVGLMEGASLKINEGQPQNRHCVIIVYVRTV